MSIETIGEISRDEAGRITVTLVDGLVIGPETREPEAPAMTEATDKDRRLYYMPEGAQWKYPREDDWDRCTEKSWDLPRSILGRIRYPSDAKRVPRPRDGHHTASPKEREKLPPGSCIWIAMGWAESTEVGLRADSSDSHYCCPNVAEDDCDCGKACPKWDLALEASDIVDPCKVCGSVASFAASPVW